MEQIVFPVHPICEFLTEESKVRVFNTTEQDEQGSKVTHFFEQTSFLHGEMEWQKKLRSENTHTHAHTHAFEVLYFSIPFFCYYILLLLY